MAGQTARHSSVKVRGGTLRWVIAGGVQEVGVMLNGGQRMRPRLRVCGASSIAEESGHEDAP